MTTIRSKIGQKHDGLVVEPIDSLRKVVALRKIKLAILCVPAEAAQRVADLLVASGIRRNPQLRPGAAVVPAHVNLVPVDLSVQLENLAYKVQKTAGRGLDLVCRLGFPDLAANR